MLSIPHGQRLDYSNVYVLSGTRLYLMRSRRPCPFCALTLTFVS